MVQPMPVTIIGGFLGAGKTSLLNHILTTATDRRIAVLVNDFGAINIDAKLIVAIEGETVSLANGCVCCTIRDDLLSEVFKLLESAEPPEHIVIETSGVSKPVAVVETFSNPAVLGLVDVVGLITLLDAELAASEDAAYGTLAYDQIATADLVVINKADLVSPPALAALRARVTAVAGRARIVTAEHGKVPLALIFDEMQGPSPLRPVSGDHGEDHSHMFEAWSFRSERRWSFNALQRATEHLPTDIYRAKGLVRLDLPSGDYGVLQMTGRRAWLRLCQPDEAGNEPATEPATELVFIGKRGATTDEELAAHFENALTEATAPSAPVHIVTDLRAFNVIFA
ncbi:GTP-binding protein [Acuticoccus sp. MNP-M23]|uniref:CobW family GTP-binding protein n=1 Tax=Acuticoccus sp. MNP-M23 TaxID=3072793 RepID=UPI002814CF53|nr:GTP-binding protein [Acuticoccus sp. MNP-M23]WMS40770.1 GTP-binding protein [Acuticoccus sp. MNP-M23]